MSISPTRKELIEGLASGNVVPVIGAGVSKLVLPSMPSWTQLIEAAIQHIEDIKTHKPEDIQHIRELLKERRLIEAAHEASVLLGRPSGEYARWLRMVFQIDKEREEKLNRRVIDKIADLLCPIIATTNYDKLLSTVHYDHPQPVTWRNGAAMQEALRGGKKVLHLHGVYDEPESVVFGIKDYGRLMRSEAYRLVLGSLWIEHTLLFIGCSADGLEDPDFSRLLSWATKAFKSSSRYHFALMRTGSFTSEQASTFSNKWKIQLIGFGDNHSDLPTWLEEINPHKVRALDIRTQRAKQLHQVSNPPENLTSITQRHLEAFENQAAQISPENHVVRDIQADLEVFMSSDTVGCRIVFGDGGTGKSTLLYNLAKWARANHLPVLYLDVAQGHLQTDWLAHQLDCDIESLPDFMFRYGQQFERAPAVLIDTSDHLLSSGGVDTTKLWYLAAWAASTRVICAVRSGDVDTLKSNICNQLPPSLECNRAIQKVQIGVLSESQVNAVLDKYGKVPSGSMKLDEKLLEVISTPLYLYLYLTTGSDSLEGNELTWTKLWASYWRKVVDDRLFAAPKDWANLNEHKFSNVKVLLLEWIAQTMSESEQYEVAYERLVNEQGGREQILAFDALIRSGALRITEGPEIRGVRFFHQRFFEFVAARRTLSFGVEAPKDKINELVSRVDRPFHRAIIVELAYLVAENKDQTLSNHLYDRLIHVLGEAKKNLRNASVSSAARDRASSISWGIDAVLCSLTEHWAERLSYTLLEYADTFKPDPKDEENLWMSDVASTIGSVFARYPHPEIEDALTVSLRTFLKKGRFVEALAKLKSSSAKEALMGFAREQVGNPTDEGLLKYLFEALGEIGGDEAIRLLIACRDDPRFEMSKAEIRYALWQLGQEPEFNEAEQFSIEQIRRTFQLSDEYGRQADWKLIERMAMWLCENGTQHTHINEHSEEIVSLLLEELSHGHDNAVKAVALALGELGDIHACAILINRLKEKTEPSCDVTEKMLIALKRLVQRHQLEYKMLGNFQKALAVTLERFPTIAQRVSDVVQALETYKKYEGDTKK
jgi:hypothetical protein